MIGNLNFRKSVSLPALADARGSDLIMGLQRCWAGSTLIFKNHKRPISRRRGRECIYFSFLVWYI